MPVSVVFMKKFNKEHPAEEFESKAVRNDYMRTAWSWYREGQKSHNTEAIEKACDRIIDLHFRPSDASIVSDAICVIRDSIA